MDTIRCSFTDVKMIAHRGASALETENTPAAFIAAGNRSYFGIETDVHVTRDGRFILHHDDSALRLTGCDLVIEETDYEVLRALPIKDLGGEAGRCDLRMPSLAEYIAICKKYEKAAVLELKNRIEKEKIAEMVRLIRQLGYMTSTIFISFFMDNLIDLKAIAPEAAAQFLTSNEINSDMIDALVRHGLHLDAKYTLLSRELVDRLHGLGITVNCWTCDSKPDAIALREMGVDQITTNCLE